MTPRQFQQLLEDEEDDGFRIRGEYWIEGSGGIEFADGDVGDQSHESIVIEQILQQIAEVFSVDIDGEGIDAFDTIVASVAEDMGLNVNEARTANSAARGKALAAINEKVSEVHGDQAAEMIKIAKGGGDPREFAMEHWGHKWMRGNNITSWFLQPSDLKAIYRGVSEIVQDEGMEEGQPCFLTVRDHRGASYQVELEDIGNLQRNPQTYDQAAPLDQVRQLDQRSQPSYYKGHMGD
jgi:hypothetical protein